MAFNMAAGLPGNLIAIAFLKNNPPSGGDCSVEQLVLVGWTAEQSPYFIALVGWAAVGVVLLCFIKERQDAAGDGGTLESTGVWSALRRVLCMCRLPSYMFTVPFSLYTGVGMAFWGGMLTRQIERDTYVGPAMAMVGVGEVLGGVLCGHLVDRTGYISAGCFVVITQGAALLASCFGVTGDLWLLLIAALLLGVADSACQTMAYAALNRISTKQATANAQTTKLPVSEVLENADETNKEALLHDQVWHSDKSFETCDAFGGYNFAQSVGTMIGFFYCAATNPSRYLFWGEMIFVEGLLCIATIALVLNVS